MPKSKPTKFIFITGGVISSLGKGIIAASLGALLKSKGFRVTIQKFDPYLNMDPGTMSPYQHGEVFVTEDGCETDLDLGHYERFIDQNLTRRNTVTSGMIFWDVLNKERRGDYLGNTVQIIPHVTNEIKDRISQTLEDNHNDIIITEVGGTVGDIESLPFLEAIRQFEFQNKQDAMHIHTTLVPFIPTSGEYKTKPTQHSAKELRAIGIHPDIIVCRSPEKLAKEFKQKIALFCDVPEEAVISCHDADSIYQVPIVLEAEKMDKVVAQRLGLTNHHNKIDGWRKFNETLTNKELPELTIAIVGKYTSLTDSYLSVTESLIHACAANNCQLTIKWVESEELETQPVSRKLKNADGILIPGGFGDRGIEGKIKAVNYARVNKIPFLGLCLGMQIAIIEFGRNVLKLKDANSIEFDEKSPHHVIDFLPDQKETNKKGGTMRLGSYPCKVKKGTKLEKAYGSLTFDERHRHRYEFNNEYRSQYSEAGLIFAGTSPDESLVEVIELPDHPWFVACQYHPEFKSRPLAPHPLFNGFVETALTLKS